MERKATVAKVEDKLFAWFKEEFVGFVQKAEDGGILLALVNGQRFKISVEEA